ncbi:MAG: Hsp20/alpha crystallin family protein [Thermoleophilia bacterium]|nr:Hsp20/alpha crystallin family protein [Thermoleophilia bacterium]MDH3724853.1 Hsp20/alpha crystallin family protein [Thermoleophilia bacterium]
MRDLVTWDPFREVGVLRREIDRLMSRFDAAEPRQLDAPWTPTADIIETDDAFVFTAELPGVSDSDVDISIDNGYVTVRGRREREVEVDEDRYHRLERSYGDFMRRFRLPEGVNEDDIHAGVAYGVLKITIPKGQNASSARHIPVSASAD